MKNQAQFGIWMDTHHATIVGSSTENGNIGIIAHIHGEEVSPNSSEKNSNHHEQTVQAKFFKEICTHLQNATLIHVTGTGQAQEKFIHFLADTPQFKNTKTEESTSNKMNDTELVKFISEKIQ